MYINIFEKEKHRFFDLSEKKVKDEKYSFSCFTESGIKTYVCGKEDVIEAFKMNEYADLIKNKHKLMKYNLRLILVHSELEDSELYKLQLLLLGNHIFDMTLCEKPRENHIETEELKEPEIWEVTNLESFYKGLETFQLEAKNIPQEFIDFVEK